MQILSRILLTCTQHRKYSIAVKIIPALLWLFLKPHQHLVGLMMPRSHSGTVS